MKIRRGFVSNSSSASYIVTLNKQFETLDDLLLDIYDTCWFIFSDLEYSHFKNIEVDKTQHPEWFALCNIIRPKQRQRFLTNEDGTYKYLEDKQEQITAIKNLLEFEHINITQVNDKYCLQYSTIMHNSFNDMHCVLSTMYFEHLVNQEGATFKFESDN